jgi:hypothetical protein
MTATALSPPPPRTQRRSTGAIVGGAVLGFVAVITIALGTLSLWSDSKTDSAGYVHTGTDRFATSTSAIATDDLDIDGAGWLVDNDILGKIRLRVDANNDKPVFVGIARSKDVGAYLDHSAYAELTDVEYSPFDPTYRDHQGAQRPSAPADQNIWVASTHGPGTQTLTWDVEEGSWSVVVMNADGSPGVDAGVSAGARITWLGPLGWSLLGAGILMLAGGTALVVTGARRR